MIINVSENKTTAFINTYIPDDSYLQRKLTNKKANFSGKVYFTEYADNLSSLLNSFNLKAKINNTPIIVCREVIYVTFKKCSSGLHWTFSPNFCYKKGSERASTTTQTVLECTGGGSYNIEPIDGDFYIENPLGGGPSGGSTTPLDNVDDDCEEGFERNIDGECVKLCYEENTVFDEITQRCECADGYSENNSTKKCEKECNNFKKRVDKILNTEGGFVNNSNDLGGPTNKGIAWDTWLQFAQSSLGLAPTLQNLQNLTSEDAKKIYKSQYWDKINADSIKDGDLRFLLFDFYVNSSSHAIKELQKTLNSMGHNLIIDGGMGPNTLKAINSANQIQLYNNFKQNRINFYNRIVQRNPSQSEFIDGWLNRVNEFKEKTNNNSTDVNCI